MTRYTAIDLTDLRERIALCGDFSPEERDLILDFMCQGDYEGKHVYPPDYGPEKAPLLKLVWKILDTLPPDAMIRQHRFLLGGLISASLKEVYARGIAGKPFDVGE